MSEPDRIAGDLAQSKANVAALEAQLQIQKRMKQSPGWFAKTKAAIKATGRDEIVVARRAHDRWARPHAATRVRP